jgi:hypothetical protein
LEALESRTMLSAYTGPIYHGVDYSPTWPTWTPTSPGQLSDSDFFNNAFMGLWGQVPAGKARHPVRAHPRHLAGAHPSQRGVKAAARISATTGRNDLGTIASIGFNLIRLYNWRPDRGWNGTAGTGHYNFLNYANSLGVRVMVPVSNYFVGDDEYSWDGQSPDASFSWDSAPPAIRTDLANFVSSITVNGQISPAVQSIEIGNELDLSGSNTATVRLERAMW